MIHPKFRLSDSKAMLASALQSVRNFDRRSISRYLLTLVALFAMTAGALADEATITLKCGTTEKTYENVTLPWSTTADILKEVVTDINFNININAISGGDGKVVKYGNENFTVTGTFSGEATVTVTYNMGSSATITVTAPGPLLTLNEAKTVATMESMPTYDVTVDYELVRDMSIDLTAVVGNGTDGVRFRIKKNAQSKYELVEEGADQPEVMDEIDAQNPTEVPAAGYVLQMQKLADDGETWENVSDYSVGTFRYVVTGQGDYDGIVYTNTFELFEGYVVKIPANEYITFFQKEMLYVEDEDVKIYTIVSVSDDEATATATEISVTSPNMPVLVKNNSAEDKNVLLIPTTDKSPDAVFVYDGFKGTLEATQIAASDNAKNNYALNGKQFVWVKNAIDIAANKAWLEIPVSATAQARALMIVFSGDTTGVDLAPAFGEGEGEWYDLNGRKLGRKPAAKGVYILRKADNTSQTVAVE